MRYKTRYLLDRLLPFLRSITTRTRIFAMIPSSARMMAPLARQSLRQTVSRQPSTLSSRLALATSQRRMASGTAKAASEQAKSDAPWAIGSLVVFGSMFVYLTAPPKGGKKHGHESSSHGHESSSEEEDSGDETEATADEEKEFVVSKKIEDRPEPGSDAPAGSHVSLRYSPR